MDKKWINSLRYSFPYLSPLLIPGGFIDSCFDEQGQSLLKKGDIIKTPFGDGVVENIFPNKLGEFQYATTINGVNYIFLESELELR